MFNITLFIVYDDVKYTVSRSLTLHFLLFMMMLKIQFPGASCIKLLTTI